MDETESWVMWRRKKGVSRGDYSSEEGEREALDRLGTVCYVYTDEWP